MLSAGSLDVIDQLSDGIVDAAATSSALERRGIRFAFLSASTHHLDLGPSSVPMDLTSLALFARLLAIADQFLNPPMNFFSMSAVSEAADQSAC